MFVRRIVFFISCCFIISCGGSDESSTESMVLLSYKTPCFSEGQMLCAVENNGSNDNFYGHVEGFDFVWGHSYNLFVRVSKITNPLADGPDRKYNLIEVVEDIEDDIGKQYEYKLVELLENTFTKESEVFYFLGQPFECAVDIDCNGLVGLNNTGGLVNVTFEYLGNGKIALVYWD